MISMYEQNKTNPPNRLGEKSWHLWVVNTCSTGYPAPWSGSHRTLWVGSGSLLAEHIDSLLTHHAGDPLYPPKAFERKPVWWEGQRMVSGSVVSGRLEG